MHPDLESLRRHYALLSDPALLAMDRSELVDAARTVYDQELQRRKLSHERVARPSRSYRKSELKHDPLPPGVEPPDWIEEGTEVFRAQAMRADTDQYEVEDRRAALEAAGIPCFVEFTETKFEAEPAGKYLEWKLLVPGKYNLEAISIIQRDVENGDTVTNWINHLEMLSDEELHNFTPERVYCGLFDVIERIQRAYDNELERRRMKAIAT